MFVRLDAARVAVSSVAALFFAAMMVSVATSVPFA